MAEALATKYRPRTLEEIAKINTHIALMCYGELSEEELRKKGLDIEEIKSLLKSPEFKREKKTN